MEIVINIITCECTTKGSKRGGNNQKIESITVVSALANFELKKN